MKLLLDPRLFNYIILTLFLLAAVRWTIARRPADACYWLASAAITAVVTFMYKH